jgi:hypothetical protein
MKINFISNRPWLNANSISSPIPTIKNIPDWYRKYDRYAKMPDGTEYKDQDGGKIPTWKACPAIYDIMGTGYVLRTPCDIKFIEINGNLIAKIENPMYQDFIQYRNEMPGFMQPEGYRANHFAWFPDWAPSVPEGYSVLYSQPFNRFDLPFLNTSGIVDNDCVDIPGTMPFFIRSGWEGVIPEGTPYMQLLPFKRDDWESEYIELDEKQIVRRNLKNSKRYRRPDGGVYLNETWHRRKYS